MSEADKPVSESPRRHKRGDVREDGMVFIKNQKNCRNGEWWGTIEQYRRHIANEAHRRRTQREKFRASSKAYQDKYPERRRDTLLRHLYGISADSYDAIYVAQGKRCAICGRYSCGGGKRRFSVDHDHKTGVVRGLLCKLCNTALGNLNDDSALLLRAVEYLNNPPARAVL